MEQRIQALEARVAAIEAKLPKSLKMGDGVGPDDLFGKGAGSGTPIPTDDDFDRIFGTVHVNGLGRVLSKWEENILNRRKEAWGGILTALPDSEALRSLLDVWEANRGTLIIEAIQYKGAPAIVFPKLPGLGYGTPECYILPVATIERGYGELKWAANVVRLIDIARGLDPLPELIVATPG